MKEPKKVKMKKMNLMIKEHMNMKKMNLRMKVHIKIIALLEITVVVKVKMMTKSKVCS